MRREILVNHVGMVPAGAIQAVVAGPTRMAFRVVNLWDGRVVLRGEFARAGSDLGGFYFARIAGIRDEGLYEIRCGGTDESGVDTSGGPDVLAAGGQISRVIPLHWKAFQVPLRTLFGYYPAQRCGDSLTGWNAPCHVRDARRADDGRHVDVTGGWHQSCDLRKWTAGTAFGLIGLAKMRLLAKPRWNAGQIEDEIRWGNLYFHKMTKPDGGLMDHVVTPEDWTEERILYANDAQGLAMWVTVAGQALAAEVFAKDDPGYSAKCLEIAGRIWRHLASPGRATYRTAFTPRFHEWAEGMYWQQFPGSAIDLGAGLFAALALYRATGGIEWLGEARGRASALAALQFEGDPERDPMAGCFRAGKGRREIAGPMSDLFLGLAGLADLAAMDSGTGAAAGWRLVVERTARMMCSMSERNAWGIVPCNWFADDPGGGRPAGSAFYRYFNERSEGRLGLNMDILGAALFLLSAWRLTGERAFLEAACRQAGWVLGCNPFDASTVEGVGRNQPERHVNTDEFFPPVPQLPGAVMTGIAGGPDDEPVEFAMGVEAEYDMPPTSALVWLLSELSGIG